MPYPQNISLRTSFYDAYDAPREGLDWLAATIPVLIKYAQDKGISIPEMEGYQVDLAIHAEDVIDKIENKMHEAFKGIIRELWEQPEAGQHVKKLAEEIYMYQGLKKIMPLSEGVINYLPFIRTSSLSSAGTMKAFYMNDRLDAYQAKLAESGGDHLQYLFNQEEIEQGAERQQQAIMEAAFAPS